MTSSGTHHVHTGHTEYARHLPRLYVDLDTIRARYFRMLEIEDYQQRQTLRIEVSHDVPALAREVDRLYLLLRESRRRLADLQAAAQATLNAHHDGEPDPLTYLRDELHHLTVVGLLLDFPMPHPDDDQDDQDDDQDDGRDRPGAGPAGPVGGGGR
jgi:hypothetical protein